MVKLSHVAVVLCVTPVLVVSLFSRDDGTIPGERNVLIDSCRQTPTCASCHSGGIGENNIAVRVSATALSLDRGAAIQVITRVTGGVAHPQDYGGFVTENTAGVFTVGPNTRINRNAKYITHSLEWRTNNRTWTYGYIAPNTPGPVSLYSLGFAADGSGRGGDDWAFHGFDGTATRATPLYMFVNTAGVDSFGAACVGSYGNYPVLGADQSPSVGNTNFALELIGAAPNAPVTVLVGARHPVPIDLSFIGVTGCSLLVGAFADLPGLTGSGNAQRGEGTASLAMPIPNDPGLQGVSLDVQAALIDAASGRPIPVTLTNGLGITIQ